MITHKQRDEMFDHMTSIQAEKVKRLEAKGWTIIEYNQLLGKVTLAEPPKEGISFQMKRIYRNGHG